MSSIFGGGTSGASERSLEAVMAENQRRQQFIEEQAGLARGDVLGLIGGGLPSQIDVFQSGNVAAQEALLAGLPQFQAAILGQPTDLSALQPRRLDVDLGFLPAQQQQTALGSIGLVDTPVVPPFNFNFGGFF